MNTVDPVGLVPCVSAGGPFESGTDTCPDGSAYFTDYVIQMNSQGAPDSSNPASPPEPDPAAMPCGDSGVCVSLFPLGSSAGAQSGGGSISPGQPKQDCSQILKDAALTVGLDAAGTVLGAIPGSGAVLVGLQVGVGIAGAANSAYHGDVGGTLAGTIGGAQLSAVAAGAEQVGWTALKTFGGTVARALPVAGSIISAGYFYKDATEALDKYQACKAGVGG